METPNLEFNCQVHCEVNLTSADSVDETNLWSKKQPFFRSVAYFVPVLGWYVSFDFSRLLCRHLAADINTSITAKMKQKACEHKDQYLQFILLDQ